MRLAMVLITLACVALGAAFTYEIERFGIHIDLKQDGTMDVVETIEVLFNQSSRGIFRKIPIHYETGKGTTRDIYLTDFRVTNGAGNELTTKITRDNPYVQIRIGDEDIWLDPGTRVTYVIRYKADGVINWFDAATDWEPYAELYWGLTGEEWDTEIHKVEFRVRFPKVEGAKGVRARLIYGPYGSRLSQTLAQPNSGQFDPATGTTLALNDVEVYGNRAEVTPPRNGLTIVLAVPSSTILKPTVAKQLTRLVLSNLGFAIPLIVLMSMSFFWWRHGKDPHGGPMVVQFDPPDGIGGPELGALLDESVDQRDLAAGVISLAVKGHLQLVPKEEGLIFKKRTADLILTKKEDRSGLTPFESKLLDKLEDCSEPIDESELRRNVAPHVGELRKTVYSELVEKGYYRTSPETARETWGCLGTVAIVLLGVLFTFLSPFHTPFPSIIGGILGVIMVWIFSRGMPKRTEAGAKAHAMARGFEEFVRRARSPELEWMTQKHPDAALFETYLPHAIAMGLTREWAQAFEGIVKEMPQWYAAPYGTPFHPVYFSNDLGSISESVGSAAAVPPRSSGAGGGGSGFSSGGGFSGGGFGGGGGGSW
jgi:uncharacterized membrane protein YgcG